LTSASQSFLQSLVSKGIFKGIEEEPDAAPLHLRPRLPLGRKIFRPNTEREPIPAHWRGGRLGEVAEVRTGPFAYIVMPPFPGLVGWVLASPLLVYRIASITEVRPP